MIKYFALIALTLLSSSCASSSNKFDSIEELYYQTLRKAETNENLTATVDDFNNIINSYPGTKYASFSRLKMNSLEF